ncbi:MAG: translation initiation factor IF-2 subunit alpha [Nitrososphaerota archaeon]|nr:translation initiation factor IF-2 subunit alpha [Nitrososphaerales archaeon]MDW8045048.1 translation initiation factor IF-2 subunit alpha [Nitrososphaerota archaeon]
MKVEVEEIPEEGELVIATVKEITPHGVYVSLDEYRGMLGFLHVSEISTGWVRDIEKFAKVGQKMVLKVIRVSKARKEIDLSLRNVTEEERREKLIQIKRAEKAEGIFKTVKENLNLTPEDSSKFKNILIEEFGGLYEAFEQVTRKGRKVLERLELPKEFIDTLEDVVKEKITIPTVQVRGIIEIRVGAPDGIHIIKEALRSAESVKVGGCKVMISYIGAPRYRIVVEGENYKSAEKALEAAIHKAKEIIEKKHGSFNFIREKSGG